MEGCVTLHTQKAVNVSTGETVYEELLVRKYRGVYGVSSIIGYAKRSGIEWAMDLDIAKEAFRYIGRNKDRGYAVGINMSDSTIQRQGIAKEVIELAKQFGVETKDFVVEISENTNFTKTAIKNIEMFKCNGVKTALDDFGAGRANIIQVADGMMDIIKIDRELIANLGDSSRIGRYIALEGIYNLCNKMKYKTIVEGVETNEELKQVVGLGFDVVQGFLFDIPKQISYEANDVKAV